MNKRLTKYWFLIYVLAALLVLGGLLNLGVHFGPKLESWLMVKLVPEVWRSTVDDLLHRLFRDELRTFLVTTGFGLGIVVIGMTLFPLKEKLSSTYEEEHFPELEKQPQPSLWKQGLEEVKLAILYLLLQGMSLYLAVQGHKSLALLGASLSIGYLIAAMALDHCSPFFQRRDRKIHGIIWILLRRAPLRTALIGMLCIGPVIILEKTLPSTLGATVAISILVFTEVIGMACATLLGCHLGAALLKDHPNLAKSPPPLAWTFSYRVLVLVLAVWLGIFFGWWTKGAIRHAHFMQCRYRPLWKEAEVKIRETRVLVALPVQVHNRSSGAIDPTELDIEVLGRGILEGGVMLKGPLIQGGETTNLTLSFEADLTEEALLNLPGFLEAEYSAHLRLEPPLSKPVLLKIFPQ
jgi:hypothetical protein